MQKKVLPYKKKYLKERSAEVDSIQNEINQIFDNHLARFTSPLSNNVNLFTPDIEISETPKNVHISAELPGMNSDDINLHISKDGYLTISGEKTNTHEQTTDEGFYFSERSYGFINRTIPLPSDIDEKNISAVFNQGVLNINIPKTPLPEPTLKKIEIKEK